MTPKQYRLLACCMLALTFVVLLMPGVAMEGLRTWVSGWWPWASPRFDSGFPLTDKLVHAALFAISGVLLVRGWVSQVRSWWPLFLMLIVYGVLTELAQQFVPGRAPSAVDVVADGVGAAVGIAWAVVFKPRRTGSLPEG